jgi:hypothetical protein
MMFFNEDELPNMGQFEVVRAREGRNGALVSLMYRRLPQFVEPALYYTEDEFFYEVWNYVEEIGVENVRGVVFQYVDWRGDIYFRTMPTNNIYSFFEASSNTTIGQPVRGSDIVPEVYELNKNTFVIRYITHPVVAAKNGSYKSTDLTYYQIADYRGDEGDCLLNILRNVAPLKTVAKLEKNIYNDKVRRLLNLPDGGIECSPDNLQKLSDFFMCNIEIYNNQIEETKKIEFMDSAQNGNRVHYEMQHQLIHNIKCVRPTSLTAHILIVEGHCSHIHKFKPIEICPYTGDLEIRTREPDLKLRILEQGRPYFWAKRPPKKNAKEGEKIRYKTEILVYDLETVFDELTGNLKPYSCGWYIFDINREDSDFSKENCRMTFGFDCMDGLIDEIASAPRDVRYLITSFNGAKFDNFILAQSLAKSEMLHDLFFTSNQIRDIRSGRHSTLDLCKLCPMTLDNACEGFKTQPVKVAGFEHSTPQHYYSINKLDEWLTTERKRLVDYLNGDVMSTCSLAVKLNQSLKALTNISPLEEGIGTIAGLSWEGFYRRCADELKKGNRVMPVACKTEKADKLMRGAIIGGRTQNFKYAGFISEEEAFMVDVCSLYPTTMSGAKSELMPEALMYGFYPIGEEIETTEYKEGKLGVYNVIIKRQPTPNIIPYREKDKPHNWKFEGEFTSIISNVSIELIRYYGGEVDVLDGYYYEDSTREMFKSFLSPIILEKSAQDGLKERKSPDYNPAMRETSKLIMNSLSGKFAQKNYDDLAILSKGRLNQLASEKKFVDGKATRWYPICGEMCLLVGKKELKYNQKKTKPVAVSVFIYEHSRAFMYHILYKEYNPIYTDTDSAILLKDDYLKFREKFPQLNPDKRLKDLGDIECELYPREGQKMIICQPKCYYINGNDDKGQKIVKAKVKGVNYKRDKFIRNKMKAKWIETRKLATVHDIFTNDVDEEVESLKDPQKLFEALSENKTAFVLCSSLRKGLDEGGFIIKQVYTVKNLILDKEAREEIKLRNREDKKETKKEIKEIMNILKN